MTADTRLTGLVLQDSARPDGTAPIAEPAARELVNTAKEPPRWRVLHGATERPGSPKQPEVQETPRHTTGSPGDGVRSLASTDHRIGRWSGNGCAHVACGLRWIRRALGTATIAAGAVVTRWLTRLAPRRWRARAGTPTASTRVDAGHEMDSGRYVSTRWRGGILCVEVPPDFGEPSYNITFAHLLCASSKKLLNLSAARVIRPEVFTRLASAWQAGTCAQLAIVLTYDSWAVLRDVALRALQPVASRGVTVEIFYEQQDPHISSWFETGHVHHDVPAVVEWLGERRRRTALWPSIVSTTAMLVEESAELDDAPGLLIALSVVALSFGSAEGMAQATRYLHAALYRLGDTPSSARAHGLRLRATVAQFQHDTTLASALLEKAVNVAAAIEDRNEGAQALMQIGCMALQARDAGHAECRFREAIVLLAGDGDPDLRSSLNYYLTRALRQKRIARRVAAARTSEEP